MFKQQIKSKKDELLFSMKNGYKAQHGPGQ